MNAHEIVARCQTCGAAIPPRARAGAVCDTPACRRQLLVNQAREAERRQHAERRAAALQLRDRAAEAAGIRDAHTYPLALVPHAPAPSGPTPPERLAAFRAVLTDLIRQATDPTIPDELPIIMPPPGGALTPEANAVLAQACGQCQGHCCRTGRDDAWLRVSALRRYLVAHPGRTPDDVLADYLAFTAGDTYENSCVYHRRDGCALPRTMRGDMCNDFLCTGLNDYLRDRPPGAVPRGFVVAASGPEVGAAAFVEGETVRPVDVPGEA